jgi:hypothetical protein
VGCSAGTDDSGSAGGSPSPADRVRARAARDSQGLVERYDAVLAAHPALTPRLRPLRAEVARHVSAFGGGEPEQSSSPRSTPTTGTVPAATSSPAVPDNEKDALASLAAEERSLADRRAASLLKVPGELARLLASVAAAGAAHAYLLSESGK